MKCCNCGKEIKNIFTGKVITNIQDCKCGSLIIDIPKEFYVGLEEITCENCGKYPFDKKPEISERMRLTFIKDEI